MQRPSPTFKSEEYFVYELERSEEMFYPNLRAGKNRGRNHEKHLLPSQFATKA